LVDITVTNPAGTSATSSSDQITIEGAPIVTAVTPVAILQGIITRSLVPAPFMPIKPIRRFK